VHRNSDLTALSFNALDALVVGRDGNRRNKRKKNFQAY
jgi:hypothetical protein